MAVSTILLLLLFGPVAFADSDSHSDSDSHADSDDSDSHSDSDSDRGSAVRFRDLAGDGAHGLDYARAPSASYASWQNFLAAPTMSFFDLPFIPSKWRGAPGTALLDADGDGDLDIYVTNGPGRANSLFSNQLADSGTLSFVDTAALAGVEATSQDSSGVCFGDTDNDGDPDLLVLSNFGPSRFYVNRGDGIFDEASTASGLGLDTRSSVSCSFGDVDGDGLLDVVVANTYDDMSLSLGIAFPFDYNQHDQLFHNRGGNVFADISAAAGIEALTTYDPVAPGAASLTWAIALVDLDLDGDLDLARAADQAGVPRAVLGGVDRGYLLYQENDGHGVFTDVTRDVGLDRVGEWMGLAFADFDRDGNLDLFASNVGDWALTNITPQDPVYGDFLTYDVGDSSSRWFFRQADGTFTDPGVGDLVATPFGWGTSAADYDNDGDTDIVFHGGMSLGPVTHLDNLGAMLRNDGSGRFSYDLDALSTSSDHQRRVVHGMAMGDLDDDGFPDIVSVSSHDVQRPIPVVGYGVRWGSTIDTLTGYQQIWLPSDTPGEWLPGGNPPNLDGSLSVEINSGNRNRWIKVAVGGSVGHTAGGRVNRDGIGAVVTVTPQGGEPVMRPVLGGSSYASQDSLEGTFGLGSENRATVEILWPGGVRNRLDKVRAGSRLFFPEIPCSFDDAGLSSGAYRACVRTALDDLVAQGVIERRDAGRFFSSAMRAYRDAH